MRRSWVRLAAAVAVVAVHRTTGGGAPPRREGASRHRPPRRGGYLPDHTLEGYELATSRMPTTSSPTSSRRRTAS